MTRTGWLILSGVALLAGVLALVAQGYVLWWTWLAVLGPALVCIANAGAMAKRPTARLAGALCWSGMAVFVVLVIGGMADGAISTRQPPAGYVAPPSRLEIGLALTATLYILSAVLFGVSAWQGIRAGRAERSASPTATVT